MRRSWLLRSLLAASCIALYPATPATAGRTVVDGGSIMTLSGYCSPETATNTPCSPYALATAIQIGGTTYNSFYVNSNGSVSFQIDRIVPCPVQRRASAPAQREPLTIWLDSCVQSQFRGRGGL